MSKDSSKYDKLTPREHVLVRSDTYVGSIECTDEEHWIYDEENNKMKKKIIKFTPGFLKIFDEILVNSADASQNDKSCDTIKVEYNKEEGFISVWNNGDNGIPIEEHEKHKILIPSMIFGELLTGSNFDDTTERTTGGRNGLGAKLVNIFSTRFIVEIIDGKRKKKFVQEWSENMLVIGKPTVTDIKNVKSSIKVTFYPDIKRFGLKDMNNDHYNLFYRRTIDIAGMNENKLKVYFNEKKIDLTNFRSYISLYYPDEEVYIDETNDRWKVGILYRPDEGNQVISFVNSINTYNGGTQVTHVVDNNIIKTLINDYIKKKDKDIKISPQLLKENLVFFINSTLVNPSFSSQTKDTCTSKVEKFGSKYVIHQPFIKKFVKCGIIDQVIELAKFKENSSLKKTDGKKISKIRGIPKLDDANKAGTKDSMKCSLILTEGDSAKAFAMSGMGVIGRDYYGAFPLKGKLLNTREATAAQLMNNEEINNLKQIIGLRHDVDYSKDDNFNQLRYGKIICLTDADVDGSHIKGLLMNFFHSIWPSLVSRAGFITSMATPIVKAFKGKEEKSFYNLTDYEDWLTNNNTSSWKIKYYKGLGTSTSAEAREYFKGIENKLINYIWSEQLADNLELNNETDISDLNNNELDLNNNEILPYNKNSDEDAILLAFDKNRADDRKVWLQHYDKQDVLKYEEKEISYSKFIHSDLIHFSNDDLSRSIPSLIDGLKPSQRKILYGAFLRGLDKTEVKVAQLAGFVSDKAAYHHGEASLTGAIIGMAQNYMGSNNINILKPNGQFGCLSPETEILLWNGTLKQAKYVQINDELIGDDGKKRIVQKITSGVDDMYEIINKKTNEKFICNKEHILTVRFKDNTKIYWKECNKAYYIDYFDGTHIKNVCFTTNEKEIKNINQYNKSQLTKEEAYNIALNKQQSIQKLYGFSDIIDIKLLDYLNLSNYNKDKIFLLTNENIINWEKQDILIDPYILGAWLGDGNHEGNGFTSADHEIVKEFVKWADTINCEVVHHTNGKEHENYHYGLRRKKSGYRTSVGDKNHSSTTCEGCLSSKVVHPACDWYFEKTCETTNYGKTIPDLNPFKQLLKKLNLFKNKHVPNNYIFNNATTRLQLLAGFIDTDGTLKNKTTQPYYEITQSERLHGNLLKSVEFIAKSLGFAVSRASVNLGTTTKNHIESIRIFGKNINMIPCKLERKQININKERTILSSHNYKFKINYLGKNNFNGWQVDQNERFLLADFTVTHNSRLASGKDFASPRYIWTELEKITTLIYNPIDDPVLIHQNEDGLPIEPEYYVPIIPMILVNGTQGIGTGFSTKIPPYNPKDIISNLKQKLKGKQMEEMDPWWQGFEGTVAKVDNYNYEIYGSYQIKDNKLIITELPVGESTNDYKAFLEKLLEGEEPKKAPVTATVKGKKPPVKKPVKKEKEENPFLSYKESNTDEKVYFELTFEDGYLNGAKDIEKQYHLVKKYSLNNMNLFDRNGTIHKYNIVLDIIDEYFNVRLEYYEKRKAYQLEFLEFQLQLISFKVKFILMIIEKKLVVNNKKKSDIEDELEQLKFPRLGKNKNDNDISYNYLLSMPIYNLTKEKIDELKSQEEDKNIEYNTLNDMTVHNIWLNELIKIEKEYDSWLKQKDKLAKKHEIVKTKKNKTV